jgi:hypothetical protein
MATQYATQAITITATTLASGSARQSASVTTDTTHNVNDYRILVEPTLAAGTPAGSKAVFVWIATSEDAGTTWTGNATASDAAITLDTPHQFNFGCAISFPATTLTRGGSFSLKAACGGSLPAAWSIIIENQVGFAFTACTVKCEEEYNT